MRKEDGWRFAAQQLDQLARVLHELSIDGARKTGKYSQNRQECLPAISGKKATAF